MFLPHIGPISQPGLYYFIMYYATLTYSLQFYSRLKLTADILFQQGQIAQFLNHQYKMGAEFGLCQYGFGFGIGMATYTSSLGILSKMKCLTNFSEWVLSGCWR